jgi:ABC-type polysaccharide transport system permease subunit
MVVANRTTTDFKSKWAQASSRDKVLVVVTIAAVVAIVVFVIAPMLGAIFEAGKNAGAGAQRG